MEVTVGVSLTNQLPTGAAFTSFVEDQLRLVRYARDAGWDAVASSQHFVTSGMQMLQPVPFLSWVAREAGEMRLGIELLLVALEHPVGLAESLATLDVLCGGRLTVAAGLGYRDEEFAAFGVSRQERVRRFEENLSLIDRLLRGEEVSADLPWCRLSGQRLSVTPLQRPRPPIYVGANADAAVRRAARLGDTWLINPHATTDTVTRQLRLFAEERTAQGLPAPAVVPLAREIFCAPTRAKALELAGPWLGAKYDSYARWGQDRVMADKDTFGRPFTELADGRFILGSPEECLSELMAWCRVGVSHFSLRTSWLDMPADVALTSLELLSKEVVPALKAEKVRRLAG
ncbi:MAG: LLM class flavin-dependent oxidoreductase [Acidimicrobiales bacterium]|nr:LLM class flavin-dependent oxidoreductase [Acidimicrobiales bacterium]